MSPKRCLTSCLDNDVAIGEHVIERTLLETEHRRQCDSGNHPILEMGADEISESP
jgi:hypothetical protein